MPLSEFLLPDAVLPNLKAASKKQALRDIADHASALMGLESRAVFEALLQRERLGSTGIGRGIAIPHGKFPHAQKLTGLFARLEKPIDFEALDHEPVDLIFLLVAPEDAGADHLKALARVARVMRDPLTIQSLRQTRDQSALYALLTRTPNSHAA
jgi:PTS system nitrogen regulatory IIA component